MPHITALTVALPDATTLVAALAAITNAETTWHPAVVAGTGDDGRVCTVAGIGVFEVPGEPRMPESITLNVSDTDGAVARLRQAGYEVVEHVGLPVAASLTVAGVGIRLRRYAFEPGPVSTVGELIERLSALPPELPVLADAAVDGHEVGGIALVAVEEWAGCPRGIGPYLTPELAASAAYRFGRLDWQPNQPPARVGGPITAVVVRRIERDDD